MIIDSAGRESNYRLGQFKGTVCIVSFFNSEGMFSQFLRSNKSKSGSFIIIIAYP